VPPPILVNFLFSASCRHLTAAAVYVDMSIESGLEEGSGEWSMVMSAPQTLNGLGGRADVARECSGEYSTSSGRRRGFVGIWLVCSVRTTDEGLMMPAAGRIF
jgi:hypothetical protein